MMFGPKLYTVHIDPDNAPPNGNPEFVREGFNVFAFLLMPFWALYHRLWLVAAVIIGLQMLAMGLVEQQLISEAGKNIVFLGMQLLFGFHGNDFRRAKLQRRGYIMADITLGENQLRAEQRFFDRYFAAS